jgi:beta-glucosidase
VHAWLEPDAPVQSIRQRFGAENVMAARGVDELPGRVSIDERGWTLADGSRGVRAEYFDNARLEGDPRLVRTEPRIAFDWDRFAPEPALPVDRWSARFTGRLAVPVDGAYELELVRSGAARVWLDGQLLFPEESWKHGGLAHYSTRVDLEADREYEVRVEYFDINQRHALVKLGWNVPGRDLQQDLVSEAVAAAAGASAALVFVGDPASEGRDRSGLSLGDAANRLVSAVAAVSPRTVVVLSSGAPVSMPWIEEVEAVLLTWYAGQEGGAALVDLLDGSVSPSGRLPVTFGKTIEDYPANTPRRYPGIAPAGAPDETWKEAVYEEGVFVGYRHFDRADIEPLFAFGHGLSYTGFGWSEPRVEPRDDGEGWTVSVTVENTGGRSGAEVVQLYVATPGKAVPRPIKELKGFARVDLAPGEQRRVSMDLPRQALAYWDTAGSAWRVEAGSHGLLLGASSRDIRHELSLDVSP